MVVFGVTARETVAIKKKYSMLVLSVWVYAMVSRIDEANRYVTHGHPLQWDGVAVRDESV